MAYYNTPRECPCDIRFVCAVVTYTRPVGIILFSRVYTIIRIISIIIVKNVTPNNLVVIVFDIFQRIIIIVV